MIGFSISTSAQSYCIMDRLALSHTVGSRTTRFLPIVFFALVLVRHSIVAVAAASDSGNLQGVGGVSKGSSARLGIRAEQAGPIDLLDRFGSEGTSSANCWPPATAGTHLVEGWRRILRDISIPGMWPTRDVQDDFSPIVNNEFQRESLLAGTTRPLALGPLLNIVIHSSQDKEDAFLREALVAEKTYPVVHWALIVSKLKQLGSVINKSSLDIQIRLPKSLSEKIEHGDQHLPTVSGRVGGSDRKSPDAIESDMKWISSQKKLHAGKPKFRRRTLLQGDISPPGMWPDVDDDESQLASESIIG